MFETTHDAKSCDTVHHMHTVEKLSAMTVFVQIRTLGRQFARQVKPDLTVNELKIQVLALAGLPQDTEARLSNKTGAEFKGE